MCLRLSTLSLGPLHRSCTQGTRIVYGAGENFTLAPFFITIANE